MKEITINGNKVVFFRPDGTPAENSVGIGGEDADGNLMFFEIKDMIRPILAGKAKYQRIVIGRVFPHIEIPVKE